MTARSILQLFLLSFLQQLSVFLQELQWVKKDREHRSVRGLHQPFPISSVLTSRIVKNWSFAVSAPVLPLYSVIAALFFGFVADIVITSVNYTSKVIKEIPVNAYIKAFVGGLIIVILALIFGNEYIGLGLDTINHTINPNAGYLLDIHWYTFLLKTLFTSLSLGAGGSGGIITPIFYIGATSGHAFGSIVAPEHVVLFAALGFVSVLSATTNTPIASTIMAVELFGIDIAHYAALGAVISFLISGHRSIFTSQILAMKKSEMLSVKIGEEVENINADLEDTQINRLKERLHIKRQMVKGPKKKKKE